MAIDHFPLWHANLRHPAGNIPLPEGSLACVCINVNFSSSFEHIVRALFGKTLSTPTREARPDTLVEV